MIVVKMMFIAVRLLRVKGPDLWGHRNQGVRRACGLGA